MGPPRASPRAFKTPILLKFLDGDISAALPLFKHEAERLPLVDFARIHYVESLRFAHRPKLALEAAEQALQLDPESRWGLGEQARCLLLLGRNDEALALAREHDMHTILLRFGKPEDRAALDLRKDLDPHAVAWQQFVAGRTDAVIEHLEADHSSDLQQRARALRARV